jgi:hypothetical protein
MPARAVTDAVAHVAHGDEQAAEDEGADVDDPQQLGARRLQVLAKPGHGEAEDGGVHRDQQDREREGDQGPVLLGAAERGGLVPGDRSAGHSGRLPRTLALR